MTNKNKSIENGLLPPQNQNAEEALLGCVLVEAKRLHDFVDFLQPDAFYNENNGEIYKAIVSLQAKIQPIDVITVSKKLKELGKFDQVGGTMAIISLTNKVGSTANAVSYAHLINDCYTKRKAITFAQQLMHVAYQDKSDVNEVIDFSQRGVNKICDNIILSNTQTAGELFVETLKINDKLVQQTGELVGVSTGLNTLNKLTCGWQNSDLIILAARPGQGKTSMVVSFMDAASQADVAVGIFSLEMSSRQLYARLIAQKTEIYLDSILRKGMNQYDLAQVLAKQTELTNKNLLFDDTGGVTLSSVINKARKWKRENKLGLLVIDYLQLIVNKQHGLSREQEVSEVSRSLKTLAKELDIPVIAVASMSRASEKRGISARPMNSDLRESGGIESDADMIMFIHRPSEYGVTEMEDGSSSEGKAELIISKHRNGPTGKVVIGFDGSRTKFFDLQQYNAPF